MTSSQSSLKHVTKVTDRCEAQVNYSPTKFFKCSALNALRFYSNSSAPPTPRPSKSESPEELENPRV